MNKVLFITEILIPPFDEGIKKTVYNVYKELSSKYELTVICREGMDERNIHQISTNALFLSRKLYRTIKQLNPKTIVYFPFASSTFASYLRLKSISLFSRKSNVVFIALQPKCLSKWQHIVVKLFLKPKYALTPSPELFNEWQQKAIMSKLFPLLTSLEKFKPLSDSTKKNNLRKKYGLPFDKFIISHMGHLNYGRNLQSLIPLQDNQTQVVVVSSTSTPKDAIGPINIQKELINNGIIIIDQYIEHIKEIYQLSDLYIFPVEAKNSSIGMPLSILEARACGIRVLTTDFGSIRHFLDNDNGNIFYSASSEFSQSLSQIRSNYTQNQQSNVTHLNEEFLKILNEAIDI